MTTITDLARRLKEPLPFIKGVAWGMGLTLEWVGPSLCLSKSDADRLIEAVNTRPIPQRKTRNQPLAAAS